MKVGQLCQWMLAICYPPAYRDSDAAAFRCQTHALEPTGKGPGCQLGQRLEYPFSTIFLPTSSRLHQTSAFSTHQRWATLGIENQYPGVRESISSDVDNVATLLRISGLIPKSIDYQPLLEEAKQQLRKRSRLLAGSSVHAALPNVAGG